MLGDGLPSALLRTVWAGGEEVPRGSGRLHSEGWVRMRQSGSHEIWQSPDGTRVVTVAGKDSDTVPAGTLSAMRRTTGLQDLR